MNYLGHVHVALVVGHDDPDVLLGAALPDLVSMTGVRLRRQRLPAPVADGVRCHVDADAAFHTHPGFRRGAADVRQHLAARGLGAGAARALGHVGWELLLDGTLLGSATEHAYWMALEGAEQVLDALDADDRRRWRALLGHRDRRPRARPRYDDPSWVAERLHTILDHRPRLRFEAAHTPAVARALEAARPAVAAAAPAVLVDVARQLGEHPAVALPRPSAS